MALTTTFATLPSGNSAASLLDTNFNQVGAMGVTACTATGTNTILLTQNSNQPTVSAYNNYQAFSFVAAAATTASATVNINSIGAKPLYKSDGTTQIGNGDLANGAAYQIVYNSALNGATGGFQIIGFPASAGAGGAMVLLSSQTISSSTASVSDTTHITNSYSHYIWEISNLTASGGGVDAYITVQQGGIFVGGTSYLQQGLTSQSTALSYQRSAGAAQFNVTGGLGTISNPQVGIIRFEFWNPATVGYLETFYEHGYQGSYVKGTGWVNANAATTGVKLALSTGNIATCQANLYGIT